MTAARRLAAILAADVGVGEHRDGASPQARASVSACLRKPMSVLLAPQRDEPAAICRISQPGNPPWSRYHCSSWVIGRPRMRFRCGKRPKRPMM